MKALMALSTVSAKPALLALQVASYHLFSLSLSHGCRLAVSFSCGLALFYGVRLQYEDDVLEAVFGGAEGLRLRDEAAQDSLVALVALPGYFVAVALIAKLGPRNVQVKNCVVVVYLNCAVHPFVPLRASMGICITRRRK